MGGVGGMKSLGKSVSDALGTGPTLSSNLHVCSLLSPLGPAP